MYSVEMAGFTKMKWLLKYMLSKILVETELKKVSANSGCLWFTNKAMYSVLACCQMSSDKAFAPTS